MDVLFLLLNQLNRRPLLGTYRRNCQKCLNCTKRAPIYELPHAAQGADVIVAERPEAGFGINLRN